MSGNASSCASVVITRAAQTSTDLMNGALNFMAASFYRKLIITERTKYLHKPVEKQVEGPMALSQLHRIEHMSAMLQKMISEQDELPAWVQQHITVAQENLEQVVGYIEPKHHADSSED